MKLETGGAGGMPDRLSVPKGPGGSREFVIGVDLDGVVADYERGFRASCMNMTGLPESSFPAASSWSFVESGWPFPEEEDYFTAHREAVLSGLFRELPVVEGASEALWRLSDAGIRIRIITHRLVVNFSHAAAVSDTVSWLDKNRIPFRDICFVRDKAEVGADLYLDDSPHNIAALRQQSGESSVAVFDQAYNRSVEGLRVLDWPAVLRLVAERSGMEA